MKQPPAEGCPALPDELRALLPATLHTRCRQQHVSRGQRLFEAGRRPAWMHFVSAGEVILQRVGEDGEPVVLQRARHGFVGEASLQTERYHCDALVVADADITRLPRPVLLDALRADAAFALRWMAMLNRELWRLRQQCERLSLNTVEGRLLHLLRTEGGSFGLPLDAGLKSLAREIGVTHEALYRCVAAMERRAVLTRRQGRLQLCPPAVPARAPAPASARRA